MLYRILRPFIKLFTLVFLRPKIVGSENIPYNGRIIIAGNHINNLDCFLLISSTKRTIHFLAKRELFTGFKSIIFSNMGLISVDRSRHCPEVIEEACDYLNDDEVIGIFPEGTTEKGKRELLPFKKGAVRLASSTNSKIVYFKIVGDYKLFSNNLKIIFGKPYLVSDNIDKENEILKNKINDLEE